MATRHTVRLHLLVREQDAGAVSQAIRERLGDRVVGLVPQETSPGLWAASGQWTPEEATALLDACAGLPVRLVRGALLGTEEAGVVVVDKGDGRPADPAVTRLTFAAAVEEYENSPVEGVTGGGR